MLHTFETKYWNKTFELTDEYLIREMVGKLVTNIPIEDLKKLVNFKKYNPFDRTLDLSEFTDAERDLIHRLRAEECIMFKVTINTP